MRHKATSTEDILETKHKYGDQLARLVDVRNGMAQQRDWNLTDRFCYL